MKNCPNKKQNLARCLCSYKPCARQGVCCECVAYHKNNNQIPGCFFPAEIEKTFDRSIEKFKNCFK